MSSSEAETLVAPETDLSKSKAKKQPRKRKQQLKVVEEKLAEKIGRELREELTNIVRHGSSADFLDKLALSPRRLCTNGSSVSTGASTTATTATTESCRNTSTDSRRSENRPMKAKYKKGGNIYTLDDLSASKHADKRPIDPVYKIPGSVYTLSDFNAIAALEALVEEHGKVSHMGILDRSYSFFITEKRDAALYFKVKDKVAVVGGDPLCPAAAIDSLLAEFRTYRKMWGWGIAFLGATSQFAKYSRNRDWVTMKFGVERVLNPMTNPVLLETGGGKRTISQSKQLLRNGISLGIYSPKHQPDSVLQAQLVKIYDTWCSHRNGNHSVQAYLTVYDPFAIPELMTYIYTKDASGTPNGFAALRKIVHGYHIDPCIAMPGAARGISEFLIISTMSLLREAGVSYLSLGFEPSTELGEISGLAKPLQTLTRAIHRRTYRDLPIGGKRDFHDKFRPDEEQEADLYLVFPGRIPQLKHMKATMHVVNIDISKLIAEDVKKAMFAHVALSKVPVDDFLRKAIRRWTDRDMQAVGEDRLPQRTITSKMTAKAVPVVIVSRRPTLDSVRIHKS
jgi:hypothetical protein